MLRLCAVWTTTLLLLMVTNTVNATIYSWEDEHGVVHFSDRPTNPNAQEYQLDVIQVKTSQEVKQTTTQASAEDQSSKPLLPPATVSIISPIHDQTIRNNEGNIRVTAVANHPLTAQTQAQLLLDGKAYLTPQQTLTWQLENINRGTHQIQIQLIKNGKVIASSENITVYLHRASALQPKFPPVKPKTE